MRRDFLQPRYQVQPSHNQLVYVWQGHEEEDGDEDDDEDVSESESVENTS